MGAKRALTPTKTHTSVICLPGYLLCTEFAYSPVILLSWLASLLSRGFIQSRAHSTALMLGRYHADAYFCSASTNQPSCFPAVSTAALWSHRDAGNALSLLLLALACQAGLHIPGMDTFNSSWEKHAVG